MENGAEKKRFLIIGILVLISLAAVAVFKVRAPKSEKTVELPVSQENVMEEKQSELKIEDITVGTGDEAVVGKKVTVNYAGTLEDGTKFDSSYDRGTPFSFNLGAGEVIEGWDKGVAGMKVGGKRKLTIPSSLGYGERGAGVAIPPNSTLIFEIELLKVE